MNLFNHSILNFTGFIYGNNLVNKILYSRVYKQYIAYGFQTDHNSSNNSKMKIIVLFCLTGKILWGKCREVRDKNIVPPERPKFSRHYVQSSPRKIKHVKSFQIVA